MLIIKNFIYGIAKIGGKNFRNNKNNKKTPKKQG
jgi:hypothetical protein